MCAAVCVIHCSNRFRVMRVVLVDGHPIFRLGVRQALGETLGHDVIGEAGTEADAFDAIDALAPDVVLMEIGMGEMDALWATREIRRRAPNTRVLVLSASDQINDVFDALQAGAAGYALKSDGPDALIEALGAVGRGQRYLASVLAPRLEVFEGRRQRASSILGILSVREQEVFRLASECTIARDMAVELGIARKTVDTHLNRINRKLGLRNMAELVKLAAGLGMLQRLDDRRPPRKALPVAPASEPRTGLRRAGS